MNKPLLLSLAAATILTSSLNAESMYERIQSMELKMKQMQEELVTLKSQDTQAVEEEEEDETSDEENNDEGTDDEGEDSDDSEDGDDDEDEEETVEDRLADLEESITDLNKNTNGSHLKFGVDYRFALDSLQYDMADGSRKTNNAFMTNRLWINMNWKATDNLSFSGQLAYNKAFGQRSDGNTGSSTNSGYNFENFDWIANENAYDDIVRVRSAYFLYKNDTFLGSEIPWTFSIGRRPSTNGHLINLREDDGAASPMGHTINVEFDGLSSKFSLEDVIGVEGMYIKLCAGRGMTNAAHKFTSAPYAGDTAANPDIDLAGLIFVPYDDGQYAIGTQYYYASNLIDQQFDASGVPQDAFDTVGGMHSATANFTMNGIGDEWSDYLDDTFFFVSGAMSVTDPKSDQRMLYGERNNLGQFTDQPGESKTGYSVWVGLQMPSIITEDGRWGLEWNQGSQYWRSITYAEDTNIGSKIATRGDAYEVYFTEPLIEDILTFQVRATYIDYKYSGSNGFFGSTTGNSQEITSTMPNASQYVDTAQDIRFYLRYRY